jgi:cupin 2 domain-containing protein
MTIRHPRLLQDLPAALDAEQCFELLQRPNIRIERIVSTGQASARTFWYDQAEHEWVIVPRDPNLGRFGFSTGAASDVR